MRRAHSGWDPEPGSGVNPVCAESVTRNSAAAGPGERTASGTCVRGPPCGPLSLRSVAGNALGAQLLNRACPMPSRGPTALWAARMASLRGWLRRPPSETQFSLY